MRVVAGSARSLLLKTPEGKETRPTTDRIKETLFNMIQFDIEDASFLDLFAGSGAIGIEALSRGARNAVFVENAKEAYECIIDNLNHTKLADKATVLKQDVFTALSVMEYKHHFDVVFLDPPYHKELEIRTLEYLSHSSLIDEDTLIIFESSLEDDIDFLDDLPYRIRKVKEYKSNRHVFLYRSFEKDEDPKED